MWQHKVKALNAQFAELLTHYGVPGGSAALVFKQESHALAWGRRCVSSPDKVSTDTLFDIGSCSKAFVATAVAQLVGEGRLTFDDRVQEYLPEFELDRDWITEDVRIRDLLCNRLGLRRQVPVESFANINFSPTDIFGRVKYLDRSSPFRSCYGYFNPGFMACAAIVERVAGLPYSEYLSGKLFAPLGMARTLSGNRAQECDNRAVAHGTVADRWVPLDHPVFQSWQGAGGIFSTAGDACQWLRFQLSDGKAFPGVIAATALKATHQPHTLIPDSECGLMHRPPLSQFCLYCLGWWTTHFHGYRLVQHDGGAVGWRAHTAFIPEAGVGVAVYVNAGQPITAAISYHMLECLLGKTPDDWRQVENKLAAQTEARMRGTLNQLFPYRQGEAPHFDWSDYAGSYRHPAVGKLVVEHLGDGQLLLKLEDGRLWDMSLSHLGGEIFESRFIDPGARCYLQQPSRVAFEVEGDRIIGLNDLNARYRRETAQ